MILFAPALGKPLSFTGCRVTILCHLDELAEAKFQPLKHGSDPIASQSAILPERSFSLARFLVSYSDFVVT
jgi:hypothetical protein